MGRFGCGVAAGLVAAATWLPAYATAGETAPQGEQVQAGSSASHDHDEEDPREAIIEHVLKNAPPPPPPVEGGAEAIAQYVSELREAPSDRVKISAGKNLALLGSQGDGAALGALIGVLRDTDAGRSRMFAAMTLRESKSSEAVTPLLEVLRDQSLPSELRKQAALSLGQLGDPRALRDLVTATDDAAPDVRYYAATALGLEAFVKLQPQAPILLKVARDREQSAFRRARAVQMAMVMGDASIVDPLIEILLVEPRSPDLTSSSSGDVTASMFTAIMSRQRNVRAKIAAALGVHGDGRVVRPLLVVATTAGDDRHFLDATQKALDRIALREGTAPFVAVLKDPDPAVRRQAVLTLVNLKYADRTAVRNALRDAAKDPDPAVRDAIAGELASLDGAGATPSSGAGASDAGSSKN